MSKATRKTRAQILKENPNVSQETIETADRLDEEKEIALLNDSEGGKILRNRLLQVIAGNVHAISNNYAELSHADLLGKCARLSANLQLYGELVGASKNAEDLERYIKESLE